MHIRSNAGEIVNPTGQDFDPVRAIQDYNAKKSQEKVAEIVKAYALD